MPTTAFPPLTELAAGRPFEEIRITVTSDRPSHHGQTKFTIRPGVVDADAVELYGFMKCHLLAGGVNALTGWRMCLIRQLHDGQWKWAHAGVLDPAGLFCDIHGPRCLDDAVRAIADGYGLEADAVVFDTFEECAAFVHPGQPVAPWTDGADPLMVEVTLYFAQALATQ